MGPVIVENLTASPTERIALAPVAVIGNVVPRGGSTGNENEVSAAIVRASALDPVRSLIFRGARG